MRVEAPILPYCGAAPDPGAILTRWNWDPWLLAFLSAAGLIIWLQAGAREQRFGFAAVIVAFVLFVSPLCALTSALFAARSGHHVLLTAVLAPLVALAIRSDRLRSLPLGLPVWTAVAAVTFWLWHVPALYAAALASDPIYWLMQSSLLGVSTAFWASVRQTNATLAAAALLTTMVQMGLLGALLTFSGTAFYTPHALTTIAWGLSPLEDQQLGGLIMWVPGSLLYLGAALFKMHRLIATAARTAPA